jgi:diadenylate cyclase
MVEFLIDQLRSFVGAIRFADALDMAVIAGLVYWLLMSVRRRTSSAGVIICLLVLAYFVARWLDMFLTQWIFQAGLTVIALAILVLFQDDARQQLERLLNWRPWSRRASQRSPDLVDTLVESLSRMAKDSTGALVVLSGADPLERHIRGGIRLDGLVSTPLLLSIFNSTSPGHDGAVVIERDRITRFAAHLPLSRHVYNTQGGTRHAAALGLAEQSDALVLVVSEERGVVSAARDDRLQQLETAAEIGHQVERFLEDQGAGKVPSTASRRLISHPGAKIAALAISVALWGLLVWNVEPVQRTFDVRVEFRSVPAQWSVHEIEPNVVSVTLEGPAPHFELLEPDQLRFSLEMQESLSGLHSVWLREEDLSPPSGIEVRTIDPQRIWFQVAERTQPAPTPARANQTSQ